MQITFNTKYAQLKTALYMQQWRAIHSQLPAISLSGRTRSIITIDNILLKFTRNKMFIFYTIAPIKIVLQCTGNFTSCLQSIKFRFPFPYVTSTYSFHIFEFLRLQCLGFSVDFRFWITIRRCRSHTFDEFAGLIVRVILHKRLNEWEQCLLSRILRKKWTRKPLWEFTSTKAYFKRNLNYLKS